MSTGIERIAAAFAATDGRAALMPYLMGGFPDLEASRAIGEAYADGQIAEAHSISAGLDYPGTGPEHAWLRDSGRARYTAVTDDEALAAFARVAKLEGIIPALESSHALAFALQPGESDLDLVCLSGRGDKDLAEALARLGAA